MSAPALIASAAVAAVTFAGAYALAHGEPATAPADPSPPAAVELAKEPLGKLGEARPLPDLAAAAPRPAPAVDADPEADSDALEPEESVTPAAPVPDPAPAPTPTPTPATPDPSPPANFDDSG